MESQAKELELKADSTMLSEKELKRRLRASLRETGMVQHMTAQVRVLVPVLEEGVVCVDRASSSRSCEAAWSRRCVATPSMSRPRKACTRPTRKGCSIACARA